MKGNEKRQDMAYAPIVLFVYNRKEHTRKTLEALKKNYGAAESILYIYSDGAKENTKESVGEVRDYISTVTGFKEVHIIQREENRGLAASVIAGVTEVLSCYDRAIIMEDDLVTTPFFLQYMNEALEKYESNKQVYSITGYSHFPKGNEKLPETYFMQFTSSWTWATWKDRWDKFDPLALGWQEVTNDKKQSYAFDYDGSFGMTKMLIQQMEEKSIDSWAVRWCYCVFLHKGLTLFPNKSLCMNTGFDGTGVHCGVSNEKESRDMHTGAICYFPDEISEVPQTRQEIKREMKRERKNHYKERIKYYFCNPKQMIKKIKNVVKTN